MGWVIFMKWYNIWYDKIIIKLIIMIIEQWEYDDLIIIAIIQYYHRMIKQNNTNIILKN